MGIPLAEARYIHRWQVGGCLVMIAFCAAILIAHLRTTLPGGQGPSWGLVAVLIWGIAINIFGILRCFERMRSYEKDRISG